jgi:hypothetical protein
MERSRAMKWAALMLAGLCACNSSAYTPYLTGPNGFGNYEVPAGKTSLTVNGAFFAPGMTVFWNGAPLTTQVTSPTAANVQVDPSLTSKPGNAQLTAQNPDSFLSAPFGVDIFETHTTITGVQPSQVSPGDPDTTLTVSGASFLQTDVVFWNSVQLATIFVNIGTLSAKVPAALLATPSDGFITVSDPACPSLSLCSKIAVGPVVRMTGATRGSLAEQGTDVAWDSTHGLFLVLDFEPSLVRAVALPDSVRSVSSGFDDDRAFLAVSSGDQFLYVFGAGEDSPPQTAAPVRLSLPGLDTAVTLSGFPSAEEIDSLAPAPGAAKTVALLDTSNRLSIVDDTTVRANTGDATGLYGIAWGRDTSTLYGIGASGIFRFSVDGTGITGKTQLVSAQFSPGDLLHFDPVAHRIYGDPGWNYDEQGQDPRPFNLSAPGTNACVAAMDGALGKAFFACFDVNFGYTVQSFDLATQQLLGHVQIGPAGSRIPNRILRFGTNGLVVSADGRMLYYEGALVQ